MKQYLSTSVIFNPSKTESEQTGASPCTAQVMVIDDNGVADLTVFSPDYPDPLHVTSVPKKQVGDDGSFATWSVED